MVTALLTEIAERYPVTEAETTDESNKKLQKGNI